MILYHLFCFYCSLCSCSYLQRENCLKIFQGSLFLCVNHFNPNILWQGQNQLGILFWDPYGLLTNYQI